MGQIILLIILAGIVALIRLFLKKMNAPGLGAEIIITFIGIYIAITGLQQLIHQYRVSHLFQAAVCKVEQLKLDDGASNNIPADAHTISIGSGKSPQFFCPTELISYTINNQSYETIFKPEYCANTYNGQQRLLHQVGAAIPCYYDPDNFADLIYSRDGFSLYSFMLVCIGLLCAGM